MEAQKCIKSPRTATLFFTFKEVHLIHNNIYCHISNERTKGTWAMDSTEMHQKSWNAKKDGKNSKSAEWTNKWKVHTFGFEDEEGTCILGFIFQIGWESHGIYIKSIVSRRTTAHLHRHCHLQILIRPLLLPRRHHFCGVLGFTRFFRHQFTPLLSNIPTL